MYTTRPNKRGIGAKSRGINIVDSRKSEVNCIPLDQKKEELEQRVGE
jgi:hypothetical protein